MDKDERLTLMCQECGHTWTARNTDGRARQCSKCRSRRLAEVPKNNLSEGEDAVTADADPPARTRSPASSIMDDPEVREKVKELEIAKLDRQLREVRFGVTGDEFIERVVLRQNLLLEELNRSEIIDDETLLDLASLCPWCGASGYDGLAFEEFQDGRIFRNGYRCASCGHWVPH